MVIQTLHMLRRGSVSKKAPRFCIESGLRLSDCLEPIIHPKASTLEEVSQDSEIGRCRRALKNPVRVVVVVVQNLNPEHAKPQNSHPP